MPRSPRTVVSAQARKVLNRYQARLCRKEFEAQSYRYVNERPIEFGFVFRKLTETCPRSVLDVGTGTTALPHLMRTCGYLVTATDNVRDYWPSGMVNRHYHVIDDDIMDTRLKQRFDLITCISVIEHVEKPVVAVHNMLSLLNEGGHLIITFPYDEHTYFGDVAKLPDSALSQTAPYVVQCYCRDSLREWLKDTDGEIVEQEYWRTWSGGHFGVGSPAVPPHESSVEAPHDLTCLLIRRGRGADRVETPREPLDEERQ